jgi:hypothetical protein
MENYKSNVVNVDVEIASILYIGIYITKIWGPRGTRTSSNDFNGMDET